MSPASPAPSLYHFLHQLAEKPRPEMMFDSRIPDPDARFAEWIFLLELAGTMIRTAMLAQSNNRKKG